AWAVREFSLLFEKHPEVHFGGLQPGTKDTLNLKNKYPTYSVHIEFSGSYDQVGSFIREIENRFTTATIRSMELGSLPNGDDQAQIELQLLVVPEPKSMVGVNGTKKVAS